MSRYCLPHKSRDCRYWHPFTRPIDYLRRPVSGRYNGRRRCYCRGRASRASYRRTLCGPRSQQHALFVLLCLSNYCRRTSRSRANYRTGSDSSHGGQSQRLTNYRYSACSPRCGCPKKCSRGGDLKGGGRESGGGSGEGSGDGGGAGLERLRPHASGYYDRCRHGTGSVRHSRGHPLFPPSSLHGRSCSSPSSPTPHYGHSYCRCHWGRGHRFATRRTSLRLSRHRARCSLPGRPCPWPSGSPVRLGKPLHPRPRLHFRRPPHLRWTEQPDPAPRRTRLRRCRYSGSYHSSRFRSVASGSARPSTACA